MSCDTLMKDLEEQIFGNSKEKVVFENTNHILVDEMEDIEEIVVKPKLQIKSTDIICDGSGFEKIIEEKNESESPDFSTYKFNNFRVTDNEYLVKLENAGGALVISDDGELMLKSSPDADFKKVTPDKASIVISKLIGEYVVVGRGSKDRPPDIKYNDLMLISEETFEPTVMNEFYKDGNTYKLNRFKPNNYLMAKINDPYKKPTTILKLIAHLVDNDEDRFNYVINWLAYMFVFLTKSQVALVLRGVQGSGKGILFHLISMLFGENYCITVGNKSLKSQFLAALFEFRLFINLNEMSHDIKSNKELKNFIKELITELKLSAEKKYENLSKAIKLFGQVLITSNEAYILEIEPEDRRFTVFSAAGNISNEDCNFFGFKDFKVFKKQIESELMDFAIYLKNYPIDSKLANKALSTPEKKALIKGTNDRFKLFVNMLLNKDVSSLESLKAVNLELYVKVVSGFKNGRLYQSDILPTYLALNPSDFNMSSQALLNKLEIYEPSKFSKEFRKKSNGFYFNL